MAHIDVPLSRSGFGQTRRADNWWVQPLVVFLGLSAFIVYSTWAAFQGQHFRFGPYLSPFYSPELFGPPTAGLAECRLDAGLGHGGDADPLGARRISRHLLLLSRRLLQSLLGRPASCTVGEPRKKYLGERSFPLIVQNIHRYFLYLALVFLVILAHDVWDAFWFDGQFGIGVGTLVLLTNLVLLTSLHIRLPLASPSGRRLSRPAGRSPARKTSLRLRELPEPATHAVCVVQPFHRWHFADLYVRMCSMGIWTDWRIL